jgi:hypothetical protein
MKGYGKSGLLQRRLGMEIFTGFAYTGPAERGIGYLHMQDVWFRIRKA